jgi:hypothetical protein
MLRKTTARSPQCPTSDWSSTICQPKVPRRMSSAQRSASLRRTAAPSLTLIGEEEEPARRSGEQHCSG